MEKTTLDRLKEILLKEGWTEQDCGELYFSDEYSTNLYSRDESEVIHLTLNTFPDGELIARLKGVDDRIVEKYCAKCGKFLYKGPEDRHLIVYCVDCPMDKGQENPEQ